MIKLDVLMHGFLLTYKTEKSIISRSFISEVYDNMETVNFGTSFGPGKPNPWTITFTTNVSVMHSVRCNFNTDLR
jgi:hypothetical protein